MRSFVILSNITVVILINYLIPTKKTFLTKLGRNSLSIYSLHFYFTALSTKIFLKIDIGSIILADPYPAMIYSILLSTILLFILSRDFVEKYI